MNPSPKHYLPILQSIKDELKKDEVVQKMFKEFKLDINDLDLIPVKFDDIEVSGVTNKGIISLNWNLLKDKKKLIPLLLHECRHVLSQGVEPNQSADDGDYLSNPFEQDAFKTQLEFLANNDGKDAANDYADQVLDHHEETGKERKKKKKILMEKVEALRSHLLLKHS